MSVHRTTADFRRGSNMSHPDTEGRRQPIESMKNPPIQPAAPCREQQIVTRTATLWVVRTPLGVRTFRHTLQTAAEQPLNHAEEVVDLLCREIMAAMQSSDRALAALMDIEKVATKARAAHSVQGHQCELRAALDSICDRAAAGFKHAMQHRTNQNASTNL